MKSDKPTRRQMLFGTLTGLFGRLWPQASRASEPKHNTVKTATTSAETSDAVTTYVYDDQRRLITTIYPKSHQMAVWEVCGGGIDPSKSR